MKDEDKEEDGPGSGAALVREPLPGKRGLPISSGCTLRGRRLRQSVYERCSTNGERELQNFMPKHSELLSNVKGCVCVQDGKDVGRQKDYV